MSALILSPDADLIALCAEHDRLEFGFLSLFHGPNRVEDEDEQVRVDQASGRWEKQERLMEAIKNKPALTMDGLRAKARTAATSNTTIMESAKKEQPGPIEPASASIIETPILNLGRRVAEACERVRSHDIHGDKYDTVPSSYASSFLAAAHSEGMSLRYIICDLPAITLQDVAVQLDAAFVLADCLSGSRNALTEDSELDAEFSHIKRAIASASRVLVSRPGALVPGTMSEASKDHFRLVWKGDLPPVALT